MTALARVENAEVGIDDLAETADSHQYLTFMLRGETHALGIMHIKEIIGYGSLTPVPMMPGYISGVINLRGAVVPVIDLGHRFDFPPCDISRRTCIVILELTGDSEAMQTVGVIVDAVNEVVEMPLSDIAAPPDFGASIHSDFIEGMCRREEGFIILLDVGSIVSPRDARLLEQAEALSGGGGTDE